MKNYKIPVLALALLALVSCAEKARVRGTLEGAAGKQVVVTRLGAGIVEPVDTVKTKADGSFSFSVPVKKGQPEFIYIYYGDRKVASLLLEKGEKAVVCADTLGKYSVTGSEGSAKLHDVEESFNAFARKMASTEDPRELGKAYVDHYRESVKYVLSNPYSLTVIPVLYEQVNNLPVFGQNTDALHFRAAADSLATVYPESRYVKALAKEADRRIKLLNLATNLENAGEIGYLDLELPDIKGEKVSISDLDAKVVLVHFWDATDTAQKMMNLETILPVYEEFSSRGFEVYSVCLSDKKVWADAVRAQELPWVNVNDGLGAASPVVQMYNLQTLPTAFVIARGELLQEKVTDAAGLRRLLAKLL